MKLFTKLMLATTIVGSMSLTSCKDYGEDETNSIVAGFNSQITDYNKKMADLQKRVDELANRVVATCNCDQVKIIANPDGSYTLTDKNGQTVNIVQPTAPDHTVGKDANGSYLQFSDGTIMYFTELQDTDGDGKIDKIKQGTNEFDLTSGGGGGGGGTTPVSYTLQKSTNGSTVTVKLLGSDNSVSSVDFEVINPEVKKEDVLDASGKKTGEKITITRKADDGTVIDATEFSVPDASQFASASEVADLTDKLAELNGGTKTDGTVITHDQSIVGRLEKADQDMKGDITTMQGDINTINGNITTINGNITTIQGDVSNMKTDITNLQTELNNIKTDITNLQQADKDMQKDIADLQQADKDMQKNIADLQQADKDMQKDIADLQQADKDMQKDITDLQSADALMQQCLDALMITLYGKTTGSDTDYTATSVLGRIVDLESRVTDLEDALSKLVTGVIVQQVWNPAIGTYSSVFTNAKTNFLMAYYGEISKATRFPVEDPKETLVAGSQIVSDLGQIYVTINPLDVDFTGLQLKLVNSLGVESPIELGTAQPATEALQLGWSLAPTRAAGNGTYIIPATINPNLASTYNILPSKEQLGDLKDKLVALVNARAKSDLKTAGVDFAKEVANLLYNEVTLMRREALGIECDWQDAYGTHRVVSEYNFSAVGVKPLGFDALDKLEDVKDVPGYNQLLKTIEKLKKTIDDKVVTKINKFLKEYKAEFENRGIVKVESLGDNAFGVTVSYKANQDVADIFNKINAEYIARGLQPLIVNHDAAKKQMTVRLFVVPCYSGGTPIYTTSDPEYDFELAGEGNWQTTGIAFNDLANLEKMMNKLINQIDGKIEKLEDKAYNKFLDYLEKVNDYGVKAIHKLAILTKPALFVNSDNGFGLASVYGTVPRVVTGKVQLYPTTYNGELISPAYMKYIKVNGDAGEVITDKVYDITSKLRPGINTIKFCAIDYTGNQIPMMTYQLEYK